MVLMRTLVATLVTLTVAVAAAPASPPQVALTLARAPPPHLVIPPNFPRSPLLEPILSQLDPDHASQLTHHLTRYSDLRTLRLSDDPLALDLVLPEGAKALLRLQQTRFIDTTDDDWDLLAHCHNDDEPPSSYPDTVTHNATSLAPLFNHIHLAEMHHFLANLTSFFNRYYRSEYGLQSQQFLQAHIEHLHATLNPRANLTIVPFAHSTWSQRTLIVRWTSPSVPPSAPAVLISAHQDSTNRLPFLRAPGADDDGSGTTALVATLAALLRGGWHPRTHPVEVHLFSAEEGGLLGSGEVARAYRREGRKVRAMYHMDVVGFVRRSTTPSIGLITDGVSPALTAYLSRLIPHVSALPVVETECGYACSDHGSFTRVGYPSACLSEGRFEDSSPHMHTTQDTMDLAEFSLEHVREFVKVAIGYLVELAGWDEGDELGVRVV